MQHIIFDIETGPLPMSVLQASMPVFDPAEVKVGNIKDPALIAAKVKAAEEKHARDYLSKAALSSTTGYVCAISINSPTMAERQANVMLARTQEDEAKLLQEFWAMIAKWNNGEIATDFIGHNILDFDLPFLVNRSWVNGVAVPASIYQRRGNRYAFSDKFIDTRSLWLLGRRDAPSSLDAVAKVLLGEGKQGDGADFHAHLTSGDKQLEASALAYAERDVILTRRIAQQMGLLG